MLHNGQAHCSRGFYFSVSTKPLTNRRCMTRTTNTGGSMARIATAIVRFHSGIASATKSMRWICMTIVDILVSIVISSGHRYWFQP